MIVARAEPPDKIHVIYLCFCLRGSSIEQSSGFPAAHTESARRTLTLLLFRITKKASYYLIICSLFTLFTYDNGSITLLSPKAKEFNEKLRNMGSSM